MRLFSFSKFLFILIVLLCLKSTFTPLRADTMRSTVTTADGGKKMVVIDGKKQPLFWCDGITKISDLDTYAKNGFNTVVVRLFWTPSKDGSLVPQDLQPQQTFAAAAAARGLYVIYALPEAPFGQTDQFTSSAANGAYFFMWESWVKGAMQSLITTPNLIGWMLPDDPRGLPFTSDTDFRDWLGQHYSSIPVLNKEWMTGFGSFKDITLENVESIIQQWRGVSPPNGPTSDADFRNYAQQSSSRRVGNPNWAFHPAALALGLYRWDAYRALMDRWAQIVHQSDPQRIVFSGQLVDYAELLALPDSVDVSVPALWPGSAENDIATGNPQAVDIARRAGRFCAMPMLPTSLPDNFPPNLAASRLQAWSDEALAHGASGLALSSWNDVEADAALQKTVQSTLAKLNSELKESRWQQAPLATTAMLLTPLADGYTSIEQTKTQTSNPSQMLGQWHNAPTVHTSQQERGLYGFCNQLVSGEPSDLVYAMRWGTQFGAVDYLSPDDLGGSYSLLQDGVLRKYATVLLPQAYWMSPPVVTELTQYVNSGGIIVADLGIGAAQAGNQVVEMPPAINDLLGVVPQRMQIVAFNLTTAPDAGLLPSWGFLASTPQSVLTAGDGPGGAAFAGPTVYTTLLPGTKRLGLGFQMPLPLGSDPDTKRFLLQRAWLSAAPHGSGLAIYAPFHLWAHWRPAYRGFDEFHRDLLGRGAALTTILNRSLFPAPFPAPGAAQLFPEMVNYPQGVVLINHTPPTPNTTGATDKTGAQMAAVATGSLGNFLWRDAICVFPAAGVMPTMPARPAPIGTASNFVGNPGITELFRWVNADQSALLQPIAVQLQPINGTAAVAGNLLEDLASKISLVVWPGADAVLPQNGDFRVPLQGGSVRIVIDNQSSENGYVIAPGSKHQLTITDWGKPMKPGEKPHQDKAVVQADANGQLQIQLTGSSLQVDLEPAA
ncbi:MAG: beta-galactosidase trimerization domain-containing protein [Abditibacteriaceae bacterium]